MKRKKGNFEKVPLKPFKGVIKMNILDTVLDIAKPIFSAGSAIFNAYQGVKQFNKNFEFNKNEAELARQREDNQIQRATADATAAGFSPLAALGNTASGATVSAPSSNASSNLDITPLISMFENQAQRKHETEMQTESLNAQKEISNASNISAENIAKIQAGSSKYSADTQAETAKKQLEESKRQFNENLTETKNANRNQKNYYNGILREQTAARTAEEEYRTAMLYQQWYKEHKLENAPTGKICTTEAEYRKALSDWYAEADKALQKIGFDQENILEAKMEGGAALIAKAAASTGTKETTSQSNYKQRQWELWLRANPQPVPPFSMSGYNQSRKKKENTKSK